MQTGDFGRVGEAYQQYSDGIRGRIRHQLVFEVIADLLPPGGDVLDMGCGDGEIAVRLAEAGFRVRGIDTSPDMLRRANERAATLPKTVQSRLTFSHGDIASFDAGESFDAVCCHGVLMYLDDSVAAIDKLARHVRIGGVLSILSKNALASGFREALRGDYAAARALVETGATTSMGNLGIATPWRRSRCHCRAYGSVRSNPVSVEGHPDILRSLGWHHLQRSQGKRPHRPGASRVDT